LENVKYQRLSIFGKRQLTPLPFIVFARRSELQQPALTRPLDTDSERVDDACMQVWTIHDIPTVKELIDRIMAQAYAIIDDRLAKLRR
jgi:hypothetical protein